MLRQTGTFMATGSDGRQYTICIYTESMAAGTFEDPNAVIDSGIRHLKTSDGKKLNYRKKGEYEVVQTGVVLTSSSPNAP